MNGISSPSSFAFLLKIEKENIRKFIRKIDFFLPESTNRNSFLQNWETITKVSQLHKKMASIRKELAVSMHEKMDGTEEDIEKKLKKIQTIEQDCETLYGTSVVIKAFICWERYKKENANEDLFQAAKEFLSVEEWGSCLEISKEYKNPEEKFYYLSTVAQNAIESSKLKFSKTLLTTLLIPKDQNKELNEDCFNTKLELLEKLVDAYASKKKLKKAYTLAVLFYPSKDFKKMMINVTRIVLIPEENEKVSLKMIKELSEFSFLEHVLIQKVEKMPASLKIIKKLGKIPFLRDILVKKLETVSTSLEMIKTLKEYIFLQPSLIKKTEEFLKKKGYEKCLEFLKELKDYDFLSPLLVKKYREILNQDLLPEAIHLLKKMDYGFSFSYLLNKIISVYLEEGKKEEAFQFLEETISENWLRENKEPEVFWKAFHARLISLELIYREDEDTCYQEKIEEMFLMQKKEKKGINSLENNALFADIGIIFHNHGHEAISWLVVVQESSQFTRLFLKILDGYIEKQDLERALDFINIWVPSCHLKDPFSKQTTWARCLASERIAKEFLKRGDKERAEQIMRNAV